jgi:hypothetical protein
VMVPHNSVCTSTDIREVPEWPYYISLSCSQQLVLYDPEMLGGTKVLYQLWLFPFHPPSHSFWTIFFHSLIDWFNKHLLKNYCEPGIHGEQKKLQQWNI